MSFIITQPWGLLALLGVPLLVWIHMLKQSPKIETIHTLFLLDRLPHMEQTGTSVTRWQSSWAFWLQIAMVLMVSFYLCGPQWVRKSEEYRISIVLDDTASMSAYKTEIKEWAKTAGSPLRKLTRSIRWNVLSSRDPGAIYYQGTDLQEWAQTLDDWHPVAGQHALTSSIETARKWVGEQGKVIYLTDHEISLPEDLILVSLGSPIENLGIYGFEAASREDGQWEWSAVIQNSSDTPLVTSWSIIETDANAQILSRGKDFRLDGQARVKIGGTLPKEVHQAWLVLNSDDPFLLDNRVPIQKPRHSQLHVKALALHESEGSSSLPEVLSHIPYVRFPKAEDSKSSHLMVAPLGVGVNTDAIQYGQTDRAAANTAAWYTVEKHFLTRDLSFMGLLTSQPPRLATTSQDIVLVWKQDRPLIILRQDEKNVRLILNWSLETSNYRHNPDLMILLYRFTEWVSRRSWLAMAENFEVNQESIYPTKQGLKLHHNQKVEEFIGRAPWLVGFFEVQDENSKTLLQGSSQFGDIREANFKEAVYSNEQWEATDQKLTREFAQSKMDFGLLGTLLLILLVLSWILTRPSSLTFKPKAIRSEISSVRRSA